MADLAGAKNADVIEFIEGALVYRLVWAMEAVRVRANAVSEDNDRKNVGRAAVALETGTADYCAALLIQNGLSSRVAARKALIDCPARFDSVASMREWVRSEEVQRWSTQRNWPTERTVALWQSFVDGLQSSKLKRWSVQYSADLIVTWAGKSPADGTRVRFLFDPIIEKMRVYSTALDPLGTIPYTWSKPPVGITHGIAANGGRHVKITYVGPKDFFD